MTRVHLLCGAAAAGAAALAWGRDRPQPQIERLPTVPAAGAIQVRGGSVPDLAVSFQSRDGRIAARGQTDPTGAFTLSTYEVDDGAPAGEYVVTVSVPSAPQAGRSPIPLAYANPATSSLTAEVKPEGENRFTFEIR